MRMQQHRHQTRTDTSLPQAVTPGVSLQPSLQQPKLPQLAAYPVAAWRAEAQSKLTLCRLERQAFLGCCLRQGCQKGECPEQWALCYLHSRAGCAS